jgi:ParB-like chromosome segregation protein Spo0J
MPDLRPITEIHPDPINTSVYCEFKPDSPGFQEMATSITENGILNPLVIRPDGKLLSGHRRLAVALHLGLSHLPCETREGGDDRVLLIEYNRYRDKTASEKMREAELLKAVLAEKASLNWLGAGNLVALEDKVDTREAVAEAIGMKPRTFGKLAKIYELAKENPNAKAKLDKIDSGEVSIDSAYQSLRTLITAPADKDKELQIPDFIRFYNSWQFSENDPRFGMPHPGRIPGQIAGNVIYYYTEPGDLVVDPMAGGGSTLDVAAHLERRSLGLDVAPRRPDIMQWDISKGFPDEAKDAQLIFMDPPYWNMIDEGYTDGSSSRKSLCDFEAWYKDLMVNAAKTVCRGGFVAVINMGQYFRLPDNFEPGYIDWPIETYKNMEAAGLTPWARVGVVYPTSLHGGYDVNSAKQGKFMLPILGDIIIMRRMK